MELKVEIVDPKLVEVAQDDVLRPVWDSVEPILERLLIMLLKFFSPAFHFKKKAGPPKQVGEASGLSQPLYPELKRCPGFLIAGMAERLKQAVTKHLCFAFLVTSKRSPVFYECSDLISGFRHALS
jgi:hypothetical protein